MLVVLSIVNFQLLLNAVFFCSSIDHVDTEELPEASTDRQGKGLSSEDIALQHLEIC